VWLVMSPTRLPRTRCSESRSSTSTPGRDGAGARPGAAPARRDAAARAASAASAGGARGRGRGGPRPGGGHGACGGGWAWPAAPAGGGWPRPGDGARAARRVGLGGRAEADALEEAGRLALLLPGERADALAERRRVGREGVAHERGARVGERGVASAPVLGAGLAADQPAGDQPVDQVGHAAARHEEGALHLAEQHAPLVVERLEQRRTRRA
jgi:hypothetical protein